MSDLLARARALRPLIEAEADASDRALTLTRPLVDAFARERLFHLMVPAVLGGLDADSDVLLDVFEELACADGSVGWSLMANASATSYVAFLDPGVAAEILGGRPESCIAGQFSPNGRLSRAGSGYRVSGRFAFGSGIAHASYAGGGGFLLGPDGAPEMLPGGIPAYLVFFVPRERIELRGGWDVMGLRATGSFDYEIPDQPLDPAWTFPIFAPQVKSGGALHRMGAIALAGLGHAGWGLGVAQRALDEIGRIAADGRTRVGAAALREQQVFQRELGRNALALRSARLLAHDVFGRLVERLRSEPMTPAVQQEISGAVAYLTEVAEAATLFAYRWSGSQGLRNPSLVQRCFRDMMTGGLHLYADRRGYEEFARRSL
jgi:alkylation response protein AidB-like acyl-CoA dehydrogenase